MRTNDPEPTVQHPLGEKVVKPAPVPAQSNWKPLEHNKHVEQGPDGRLRTNLPLP